jgi:hypothetical protein
LRVFAVYGPKIDGQLSMILSEERNVPEKKGKDYSILLKKFIFFISCSSLLSRPRECGMRSSECGIKIKTF